MTKLKCRPKLTGQQPGKTSMFLLVRPELCKYNFLFIIIEAFLRDTKGKEERVCKPQNKKPVAYWTFQNLEWKYNYQNNFMEVIHIKMTAEKKRVSQIRTDSRHALGKALIIPADGVIVQALVYPVHEFLHIRKCEKMSQLLLA